MIRHNLKRGMGLLLGLVLAAGLPTPSHADWLGFRNDLKLPIIVRTLADTMNGQRADSVMILYPGEVRWTLVKDTDARIVVVSEVKPPRKAIAQKVIPAPAKADALYGIQQRASQQGPNVIVDVVRVPGRR